MSCNRCREIESNTDHLCLTIDRQRDEILNLKLTIRIMVNAGKVMLGEEVEE